MTEVPSQVSPDIKIDEQTMRHLVEEELGSLVQEEVDLDAQIEAQKILFEQKRGSGQNIEESTKLLRTLEEKRGRVAVALGLTAQKHGYELSTAMGDNTHNILINGILKKQGKEAGGSVVSNTERDTISHMELEKPPLSRRLIDPTEHPIGKNNTAKKEISEIVDKLPILEARVAQGDQIAKEEIVQLEKKLAVFYSGTQPQSVEIGKIEESFVASPEQTSVGDIFSITYESPGERELSEKMPTVSYKDTAGTTIPMREAPEVKEEVDVGLQKTSMAQKSSSLEWSPATDPILALIEQEEKDEQGKISRAGKQLRDPLQDTTEYQNTINLADAQLSELDRKRENYIKEKISSMSPEEVATLRTQAHKEFSDNTVTNRTVATTILRLVNKHIEQNEKKDKPSYPQETSPRKQSPQEELAVGVNEVPSTEQITQESPSVVSEITTSVSYQAETTTTPETQEEIIAQKEERGNPFEKAIAKIKSEDPARAERLLATIGANPEQKERIEKLLGATEAQAQKVEQEIKEKDHWVVERLLKIGDGYRKIKFRNKFIASLILVGGASALAASGGAGAAMIATAALTGSGFQRMLGSLAMFATVEGALTKRSIARNEKEQRIMGMRMNVILGALAGTGVFLGGKLLGEYLSTHTGGGAHEAVVDKIKVPPTTPENTPDLETQSIYEATRKEIHRAIPLPHEATEETASSMMTPHNEIIGHAADKIIEADYSIHSGDNLWNIIKEKIPEIQDLDGEGRQSNAIANIIEQIKKDPESFGISSGNVDTLSAGDTIHLDKIHDVLKTTTIPIEDGQSVGIIERASGLTDVEASHIMENNAKISAWHTTHPDTLLTTETVDKILKGTIDSGAQTNHLAEITKDYTLSMPDTGGRTIEQLSAEALSLDTNAILHADVQTMFGSKGFFGYGFLGTNGESSVDWLNLKDHTVNEVLSKKFVGTAVGEEGGVQKFGIDSLGAVDKMKGYIKMLIEKAGPGISPEPTESVEHFSKRAISVIISKK